MSAGLRTFRYAMLCAALMTPAATAGFTPHLLYDTALVADAAGGTRTGVVGVGAAHLQLLIDGKSWGADGFSVFLDALGTHGGAPDALIGDAQGVSNIAAPPAARLYEGWVQYAGHGLSVLAGRYDLNSEFYRLSSAGLFLDSSFGIGPAYAQSGVAGPSIFPDPSYAVRFAYKPRADTVLRLALVDDEPPDAPKGSGPAGLLIVGEAAWLGRSETLPPGQSRSRVGRNANLPAYDDKIALGVWYDTKGSPDKSVPGIRHHAAGAYLIADHLLAKMGALHLAGFVQLGVADGRVGRFGSYVGAGLIAKGLVPGRPQDEIGLAVARAANGAHYRALQESLPGLAPTAAETTLEATYLAQVSSWLAVQPDLQWVIDPSTRQGEALVLQLEAEVAF